MRITLTKHDAARRTLGRLIRAYHEDKLEESKFRAMVYGFNALLAYYKLEADLRIEDELNDIREHVGLPRK